VAVHTVYRLLKDRRFLDLLTEGVGVGVVAVDGVQVDIPVGATVHHLTGARVLLCTQSPALASDAEAHVPDAALRLHSRRVWEEAGRLLATDASPDARATDLYVPRAEVESRLSLECRRPGISVVVGESGIGKTSLLWSLARTLERNHRAWLFLRATDLVPTPTPSGLVGTAVPVERIAEAVAERARSEPLVVLVDTVDVLLRSQTPPPELLNLLDLEQVVLVLTCRKREYLSLRRLDQRHQKMSLGPYNATELQAAVEGHARHYCGEGPADPVAVASAILGAVSRELPLRAIVERPLTLRLLFETQRELLGYWPETAHGAQIAPTEMDVTDLFEAVEAIRVRADRRVGIDNHDEPDLTRAADFVSLVMLALGRPTVGRATVRAEIDRRRDRSGLTTDVESLVRRHVLFETPEEEPGLEFPHQTLFEHAAAGGLIRLPPAVLEDLTMRVENNPLDLFLAAVLHQTLVRLCRSELDAIRVDPLFAQLLRSDDPTIQQLAVAAYGQARFRGQETKKAGQQLLTRGELGLRQRFVTYAPRVRHDDSVLVDLTTIWREEKHHNVRTDILRALAGHGALCPGAVKARLECIDWLDWFKKLPSQQARDLRDGPLSLVRAMGRENQLWAAATLNRIAQIINKDSKTQDALAAVLAVAADVLIEEKPLLSLIDLVPDTARKDDSGTVPLRQALAKMYAKVTRVRGQTAHDLAENLLGQGKAKPGPDTIRRKAQWLAVAVLASGEGADAVQRLLSLLLPCKNPHHQTDFADHTLRPLLDGTVTVVLPTAGHESARTATATSRDRCVAELRQLPQPEREDNGRRGTAALCRAAFDHADIPAGELADVLRDIGTDEASEGLWTDPEGLACLTIGAALGGHQQARTALDAWDDQNRLTRTADRGA
ncbi:MAG: ATP-binding protein, partial [Actinomycetota bacterium]|nr:ATP-binding protein [Actinomycetota bacterium]